jgi:hypothetical protein
MARRPPRFVLNSCGARHLNIAHGLYPKRPMTAEALNDVIAYLNENVCSTAGRTYAGGLLKFEPKEVERLPIPVFASFADLAAYKHGNEKRRKKSSNMVQPGVAASRGACP